MIHSERARIRVGSRGDFSAWQIVITALVVALACQLPASAAEVTVHDPERAFAGYNLGLTHSPTGAILMDMDGATLHQWSCRFEDVFPGHDVPDVPGFSRYWTTARLLPDGGILGVFGGVGLVKLDWSSRVVWTHAGGEHDDIAVAEDGRIYALGSVSNRVNWVNQKSPIIEDYLYVLSADGEVLKRVSLVSAMGSSDYSNIMKTAHMGRADHVMRANSLQILDGSFSGTIPSFGSGNVLVSLRGLDTIAVVDVESGLLTWALFGMWLDQLDAVLLEGGDVLLLEHNNGNPAVIQFGAVGMELGWSYERESPNDLVEGWGGAVQRLPNGNTLVSESGRGRAFEVTPDGDVVWEFVNSVAGGAIARPFELRRVDPATAAGWSGN